MCEQFKYRKIYNNLKNYLLLKFNFRMKQKKREKEAEKGGYKLCDTKIEPNYDHSSPWIAYLTYKYYVIINPLWNLNFKNFFHNHLGTFLPKKTHFCLNCSISVSESPDCFPDHVVDPRQIHWAVQFVSTHCPVWATPNLSQFVLFM